MLGQHSNTELGRSPGLGSGLPTGDSLFSPLDSLSCEIPLFCIHSLFAKDPFPKTSHTPVCTSIGVSANPKGRHSPSLKGRC